MPEITLHGGPFDGRRYVAELMPEINMMLDPSPIDQFNFRPLPGMPPCLPSKRYTYLRVGDTADYVWNRRDLGDDQQIPVDREGS